MTSESRDDDHDDHRLRGAQADIRDAFVASKAGLFVMLCVPGAGKSYTLSRIAAELIIRRAADGVPSPEYGVCAISFSKEDAADITPDVVDWIERLVEEDATPAASRLTEADAERVVRRVRAASNFGTIDGLIRSVFEDIACEIGFDSMPAVGNEALQQKLHGKSVDAVRDDPELAATVERLEAAYPADDEETVLADLLEDLRIAARQRRLDPSEVHEQLHSYIARTYVGGRPTSTDDLRDAVEAYCRGTSPEEAFASTSEEELQTILAADQRLHDAWRARVDDLADVYKAYMEEYERGSKERGIVAHEDSAHYVADYLESASDASADERQRRVLARHRDRLRDVLIDEAQDVSQVQHDALAPLVTEQCRVTLAADLRQCVYVWRDAHPEILQSALERGEYFGVDWNAHTCTVETASRSYRCRPDVAAAINTMAGEFFEDPSRGDAAPPQVGYDDIDADRPQTPGPNVHVATFTGRKRPGSGKWVDGQAQKLSHTVAHKLEQGAFGDPDDDDEYPGVTVLFRFRWPMSRYADAFAERGLSVGSASEYLFDSPAVETVLATVAWLANPLDEQRLAELLSDSPLALDGIQDVDGSLTLSAAREATDQRGAEIIDALSTLRDDVARRQSQPAAVLVRDIVDALDLQVDPFDVEPDDAQRIANVDRLVSLVREWEGNDRYDLAQLHDLFEPFADDPQNGFRQPVIDADEHDVVFKTVHQAKGSEDDTVVLATPDFDPTPDPRRDRLLTAGRTLALAPPENVLEESYDVPGVGGGLYDPDGGATHSAARDPDTNESLAGDAGLRWASSRWTTTRNGDLALAGPPGVRDAMLAQVAESWRLLFVGASRARNHLVAPIPENVRGNPRDRWSETLRRAFDLDASTGPGTHTSQAGAPFEVSVDEATFVTDVGTPPLPATPLPPRTGCNQVPPWVVRFLRPSTAYPLAQRPDEYRLDHLLGRSLHSASSEVDGPDLVFETMGPEEIGQFVHGVAAAAARRRLTADALRRGNDQVHEVIDRRFERDAPRATQAERDAIRTYLVETVLPQLADTALWERVQRADVVHTETSLERVCRVDGHRIEINGQADLILEKDGTRSVEDLKTGLAATEAETAERYEAQTALYTWLLDADPASAADVVGHVTTVGEERGEEQIDDPHGLSKELLQRLVSGR